MKSQTPAAQLHSKRSLRKCDSVETVHQDRAFLLFLVARHLFLLEAWVRRFSAAIDPHNRSGLDFAVFEPQPGDEPRRQRIQLEAQVSGLDGRVGALEAALGNVEVEQKVFKVTKYF